MTNKKEYNKLYYEKNRSRLLHEAYLKYQLGLRFCGACGRTINNKYFGIHIKSKNHINNESIALFNIYDFPYRPDIYLRKIFN